MRRSPEHHPAFVVLVMAVMVIIGMSLVYFSAKAESEAFNRLTGRETTAWDAFFLELRLYGD